MPRFRLGAEVEANRFSTEAAGGVGAGNEKKPRWAHGVFPLIPRDPTANPKIFLDAGPRWFDSTASTAKISTSGDTQVKRT